MVDRDPLLTPDEEQQQRPYPPWIGAAAYILTVSVVGACLAIILEQPIGEVLLLTWILGALWKVCLIQEGG